MKKSFVRVAAGASALAMLMAGCGGATSSSGTTSSGSTSSGSTSSGGAARSGKELTYWSMWNSTEGQAKVIQEAADAYYEATGVKINIEWKGRDVKTLIGPALDAGEKIDFFDTDYMNNAQQNGKYLADLTEMAEAADYESHALPVLVENVKSWSDGKLTVIPYQPYTTGVWYNKAMFENAGIEAEPKTWEEFLDVCEKLKASGVNAITCNSSDLTLLYGYQFARYVGQEKVVETLNEATWSSVPEAKQAADEIRTLFDKGYMSENAPAQWPEGQNELGFDESAMILQASWVPNEIVQNTMNNEIQWGFFPWPSVTGGVDGPEAAMIGAQGFGIVDKSENKQEAFDFLMTVVTGEYDLKMAEAVSSIPSDIQNTQWPASVVAAQPYYEGMTKAYNWAIGLETNNTYKDILQNNLGELVAGNMDGQAFVDAMTAAK